MSKSGCKTVVISDLMQRGYRYELSEPTGRNFDPRFQPELTSREMLALGVFGGRYMRDCKDECQTKRWVAIKRHTSRFKNTAD